MVEGKGDEGRVPRGHAFHAARGEKLDSGCRAGLPPTLVGILRTQKGKEGRKKKKENRQVKNQRSKTKGQSVR